MKAGRAFSLIELIVSVAIVGLLAAIALPAYRNYQRKSDIASLVIHVEMFKKKIFEYYDKNGGWPTLTSQLNMGTGGSFDAVYRPNKSYITGVRLLNSGAADVAFFVGCAPSCAVVVYDFNNAAFGTSTKMELWFRLTAGNGILNTACGLHRLTYNNIETRSLFPEPCQVILYTGN